MNEMRRTLLKGMFASSVAGAGVAPFAALAAKPQAAFAASSASARPLLLMLAGSGIDPQILDGAHAAAAEFGIDLALTTLRKKAGILDIAALDSLLRANRGMRVVGVTDDAGYVLLSAVARDAGASVLVEGRHGDFRHAGDTLSRHYIRTAGSANGLVEHLVAGLARGPNGFSVETDLTGTVATKSRDWAGYGFTSYQVDADRPFCLHLSGLPLAAACVELDLAPDDVEPMPRMFGSPAASTPAGSWPSVLGYALCRSGAPTPDYAAAQVFIRGDTVFGRSEKFADAISFVIDL